MNRILSSKGLLFSLFAVIFAAIFCCLIFANVSFDSAHAEGITVTRQPSDVQIPYGSTTVLSVGATYEGELNYQWHSIKDNVATSLFPDGNAAEYTVRLEEIGEYSYFCKISDSADPSNYIDTDVCKVTLNPKDVYVYIASATSVYGEPDADFSAGYRMDESTLVGEDTVSDLGITLSRAEGRSAGQYEITGEATNAHYNVNFITGTYTITPRPLTILVSSPTSVYGEDLLPLQWDIDDGYNLVYDDAREDLNVVLTKAPGADAGRYPITATWDNPDYAVKFRAATYTIAPVTVEARLTGITNLYYSGEEPEIGIELLGQVPEMETTLTFNKAVKNAGDYVAYARLENNNYRLLYSEYPFTVKKAPLTVGFGSLIVTVGDEIEPNYYYLGFVNGEDESALSSLPQIELTDRTPGRYEVTPQGAAADNYEISYRAGTVQINLDTIASGNVVLKGSFEPDSRVSVGGNNDAQLNKFRRFYRIPVYSLRITGNMSGKYTAAISGVEKGFPLFRRVALVDANGKEKDLSGYGYDSNGNFTFTAETPGILVIYYDILTPIIIAAAFLLIILIIVIKRKSDKRKYKRVHVGHYIAQQYAEEMVRRNPATGGEDEE